jgi:predicted transcriptional regulator
MMAQAIATVLVAIIGLIGIVIQNKSNSKLKSQEDLLKTVDDKMDKLKTQSIEEDKRLNKKLDIMDMDNCKRFLIVEMTKIQDGMYTPNEEQKRMLYETKERYNNDGGDSYVDSMFEGLQAKGLL